MVKIFRRDGVVSRYMSFISSLTMERDVNIVDLMSSSTVR